MNILITGGTGMVGKALSRYLIQEGHSLIFLTRSPRQAQKKLGNDPTYYQWNAPHSDIPAAAFKEVDAVINLMGENVIKK